MLQKKRKQKIKEVKKSRKGKDEIASKLLQKKLIGKPKKNREFKVQINLLFMATAAACLALTGLCHRNFGGNLSKLS